MNGQCGLVNAANPCRCPKKTKGFIDAGHVDPRRLQFASPRMRRVKEVAAVAAAEAIDDVVYGQHAAIFRDHPFMETGDQVAWLRRLLAQGEIAKTLHLD